MYVDGRYERDGEQKVTKRTRRYQMVESVKTDENYEKNKKSSRKQDSK